MAKQTINIGTTANDGTGTPIRDSFDIVNDNFTEVYGKPDLSLVTNTLTLTKADGTTDTVDLAPYLDEDARAIASGTIDGSGIVTFTRDDATTFTLDLSSLLDDTNLIASVNGQTGTVVLDSDDIAEGSTNEYYTEAKVSANTSVAANTAKVTNANHTGDVEGSTKLTIQTMAVTTRKIAADAVDGTKIADDSIDSEHYVDGSIDTAHIADDQITHAKLEDRYTAIQDIATTTGTIDLEADKYAAFNLTGNLGTVTLDIHDIKTGQAIDIILSGADLSSAVITLDASVPFTTVSINKVGSTSIDTAAKNIIQVLCVDDTVGDAILTWAVASYATGTSV